MSKSVDARLAVQLTALNHTNVRLTLHHTFPTKYELVEEYISESEHQDGRECWKENFKKLADVVADFQLYESASKEAK